MKIEKVAVLGAGAVGSYVIWGLSQKKEIRLGVIAEGERAERLKKGCRINGVTYNPEVWTPQEAQGVDLLVVCLKYGALPEAIERTGAGDRRIIERYGNPLSFHRTDSGRNMEQVPSERM